MITLAIPRWVPLALGVGAVSSAASLGSPVVSELVDTVKIVATRYELSTLVAHLRADAAAGVEPPDLADPTWLTRYIERNARAPGRKATLDFWGTPYGLEGLEGGKGLRVFSCGPNRARDACVEEGAKAPGVAAPGDTASAANEPVSAPAATASATNAPSKADDVCVSIDAP